MNLPGTTIDSGSLEGWNLADLLNSDERKELAQLRRESRRLELEQEILSEAAWFAREADTIPRKSSDS